MGKQNLPEYLFTYVPSTG